MKNYIGKQIFAVLTALLFMVSLANANPTINLVPGSPNSDSETVIQVMLEGQTASDKELLKASGTAFTLEFSNGVTIVDVTSKFFDTFTAQFNAVPNGPEPGSYTVPAGYPEPIVTNNDGVSKTMVAAARCTPTAQSSDNELMLIKVKVTEPGTVTLKPTVLNNPDAGYNVDTKIDVLVGSDSNKEPTENGAYPVLIGSSMGDVVTNVGPYVGENDIDEDGLIDSWEIEYFGSIKKTDGGSDYDQDGITNKEEYQSGSNPLLCNLIVGTQYSMVVYGTSLNNDLPVEDGDIVMALGPGGTTDCRAHATVETKNGNKGFTYLTIQGDTEGEIISFRLLKQSDISYLDGNETFGFENNETHANVELHFGAAAIELAMVKGWNWISLNVLPDNTSIEGIFGENTSFVEQVICEGDSATYDSFLGWLGNSDIFSKISIGKMFKVKANEAFTFAVSGQAVPLNTQIQLNNGWTWIAYIPTIPMNTDTVVNSILDHFVQISNGRKSRTKDDFIGMIGGLTEMNQGEGYVIKTTSSATLVYPK
ncbi:MAG: hypothetical protein OMM_00764 [Candidatus Magnetoglobus multicellularis str. Araruama]|uniref:Uncharacterized protein n=1 Tax=Candidatus Magnetoglobus multicellularis str. Araruama TaxID=890399 RepID=A0A1V1PFN1_9BACT|nr:MAG: hypothetical protein OMM_00764 [Candidatus Magnetoglobus multicellularis str. Araruama]